MCIRDSSISGDRRSCCSTVTARRRRGKPGCAPCRCARTATSRAGPSGSASTRRCWSCSGRRATPGRRSTERWAHWPLCVGCRSPDDPGSRSGAAAVHRGRQRRDGHHAGLRLRVAAGPAGQPGPESLALRRRGQRGRDAGGAHGRRADRRRAAQGRSAGLDVPRWNAGTSPFLMIS